MRIERVNLNGHSKQLHDSCVATLVMTGVIVLDEERQSCLSLYLLSGNPSCSSSVLPWYVLWSSSILPELAISNTSAAMRPRCWPEPFAEEGYQNEEKIFVD